MDLMGSDAWQSEDAMRRMWGDSIKAVKCQHARINYDDFLLLMKGQNKDVHGHSSDGNPHIASEVEATHDNDTPLSMDEDDDIQSREQVAVGTSRMQSSELNHTDNEIAIKGHLS
jgi:hypothetical protein